MTSHMCFLNICPCNLCIPEEDALPDVTAQMGQAAFHISLKVYVLSPVVINCSLGETGQGDSRKKKYFLAEGYGKRFSI